MAYVGEVDGIRNLFSLFMLISHCEQENSIRRQLLPQETIGAEIQFGMHIAPVQ